MNINDNENIVAVDVDGTLVILDKEHGSIDIENPYSKTVNRYRIHNPHVELVKQYKGRGCFVRIWSHSGVKWAEAVVEALGLKQYVDSIETKPTKLLDDLPNDKIFKNVIFLREDGAENK